MTGSKSTKAMAGAVLAAFALIVGCVAYAASPAAADRALAEDGALIAEGSARLQMLAQGSASMEAQSESALTLSASTLNFYLHSGYEGRSESGALRSVKITNSSDEAITGIKIESFTNTNVSTTVWVGGEPTVAQNPVPYVYTDQNGTLNSASARYMTDVQYWGPAEAFDLAPGASKTLYFTVAPQSVVGYALPVGTEAADTLRITADNAETRTLSLNMHVYDPSGVYARVGIVDQNDYSTIKNVSTVNLGTMTAGTGPIPTSGTTSTGYSCAQRVCIQNASTTIDAYTSQYPDIVVQDVYLEDDDDAVFGIDWGGRYFYRRTLSALQRSEIIVYADATYLSAGTYTATLCYVVAPHGLASNVAVENGPQYQRVLKVPITVTVEGGNSKLPTKVNHLNVYAGNGLVHLSWDPLYENNKGFSIYRTDQLEDGPIAQVGVDQNCYTDTDVVNNTTYTYYVVPIFGNQGSAEESEYVSATPTATNEIRLSAPTIVNSESKVGTVGLTWQLADSASDGSGQVDRFRIYMDGTLVGVCSRQSVVQAGTESDPVYQWSCDVPLSDAYNRHQFQVAAVAVNGLEGMLSSRFAAQATEQAQSEAPITTGLSAVWSAPDYETSHPSGVTLNFSFASATCPSRFLVYRDGVLIADVPLMIEVQDEGGEEWRDNYVDLTAREDQTYTYEVVGVGATGLLGSGLSTMVTTTGGTSIGLYFNEYSFTMSNGQVSVSGHADGTLGDQVATPTYTLWRNGVQVGSAFTPGEGDAAATFTDRPGDGSWTYQLKAVSGKQATYTPSYTWAFDSSVSESDLVIAPSAPELYSTRGGGWKSEHKTQLNWNAPIDGGEVEAYEVYSYAAGQYTLLATVSPSATTWIDYDVAGERTYCVRAVNAAGASAFSNMLTQALVYDDDWATASPGMPMFLVVEDVSDDKADHSIMHVKWAFDESTITSEYLLEMRDKDGEEVFSISGTPRNGCEIEQRTGPLSEGSYTLVLTAINSLSQSSAGSQGRTSALRTFVVGAIAGVPQPPQVNSNAESSDHIALSLSPAAGDPNASFITSYRIERADAEAGPYAHQATVLCTNGADAAYDDYAIERLSSSSGSAYEYYYYKVVAINEKGESDATIERAECPSKGPADSVVNLIETLPPAEDVSSADAGVIAGARSRYDALPDVQKRYVTNYDKLCAAEEALASQGAVKRVEELIRLVPAPADITINSYRSAASATSNARQAFDRLTSNEQAIVNAQAEYNESRISAAEQKLATLQPVVEVNDLILSLPPVAQVTLADRDAAATARSRYDALSAEQKALITADTLNHLEVVEGQIATLLDQAGKAAQKVQALIDELSAPTSVTLADKDKIAAARAAYDALSNDAKSLVDTSKYAKLVADEAAIRSLESEQFDADCKNVALSGPDHVRKGSTITLSATSVADTAVVWDSTVPGTATVDAAGNVTGLVGSEWPTTIAATYTRAGYGGRQLTKQVSKEVTVIDVALANAGNIALGGSRTFAVVSVPESAYTWTSSDPTIAWASSDGTITGRALGTVTITATSVTYPDISVSATVQVTTVPITGMTLTPDSFTYNGASQRPAVAVSWEGGTVPADSYTITWPQDTTSPGVKTVTATAKGNYTGEVSATYTIEASGPSGDPTSDPSGDPTATKAMHRVYNPNSYEHFYTADDNEFANLVSLGWRDEGIGWMAPETSDVPVYRLYNPNNGGDHHYTRDAAERDTLVRVGWRDEGIGWYSASEAGGVPVYREYNPNELARNHNYTANKEEHDHLVSLGWHDEGIAWYGL